MEHQTQQHHYFASFALGWATAPTRKEAIEKLVKANIHDFRKITAGSQQTGNPGCYLWTCQVNVPENTNYEIEGYVPKADISDGLHHHTTYVTTNKVEYTSEKRLAENA